MTVIGKRPKRIGAGTLNTGQLLATLNIVVGVKNAQKLGQNIKVNIIIVQKGNKENTHDITRGCFKFCLN
jgi:hypothetical protein